jgi:hypothetical protein
VTGVVVEAEFAGKERKPACSHRKAVTTEGHGRRSWR